MVECGLAEYFRANNNMLFIKFDTGWKPITHIDGDEDCLGKVDHKLLAEAKKDLTDWLGDNR